MSEIVREMTREELVATNNQLDEMHDYVEYELTKFIDADLCKDCLNELETIIKNYLHREKVEL